MVAMKTAAMSVGPQRPPNGTWTDNARCEAPRPACLTDTSALLQFLFLLFDALIMNDFG